MLIKPLSALYGAFCFSFQSANIDLLYFYQPFQSQLSLEVWLTIQVDRTPRRFHEDMTMTTTNYLYVGVILAVLAIITIFILRDDATRPKKDKKPTYRFDKNNFLQGVTLHGYTYGFPDAKCAATLWDSNGKAIPVSLFIEIKHSRFHGDKDPILSLVGFETELDTDLLISEENWIYLQEQVDKYSHVHEALIEQSYHRSLTECAPVYD